MIGLILTLVIAVALSYFALQNTQPVTVRLQGYVFDGIPLFLVAMASMVIGIAVSFAISLVDSLSNAFTLLGKDHKIRETERTAEVYENKIRDLEVENERLRGKTHHDYATQSAFSKPNVVQRLRHRLSV